MMERSTSNSPATKRGRSQDDGAQGAVTPETFRRVRTLKPWVIRRTEQDTYRMAYAAAWDAGNASMRAAGRSKWNRDDWNAMCAEFSRLMPEGGQS